MQICYESNCSIETEKSEIEMNFRSGFTNFFLGDAMDRIDSMMERPSPSINCQIPMVIVVDEDDQLLSQSKDAVWYEIIKNFPWENYRDAGADYYNALHHFNQSRKDAAGSERPIEKEEKVQASIRFVFDRPTVNKDLPVIFQPAAKDIPDQLVLARQIEPGIIPTARFGGRKPKCFFALLKSFIGVSLMGFAPEPEVVWQQLASNPAFARACGFLPKGGRDEYWQKHVPSLRKLEQFDQIMAQYGLWGRIKIAEVRRNIETEVVKKENVVVGDTTHYHAFSGFETVKYTAPDGEEKKKSQSKPTKNCRCENRSDCPHSWELSDDGAGTIVKRKNKVIWGHKASVVGLPSQGVPLDAAAVADAATHDGETFHPHVKLLFETYPEIQPWFDTALYDSAADIRKLKDRFQEDFGIQLKTSLNPRRRKTIAENLPKGMKKLTPFGNLTCINGIEMNYMGARYDSERFIYQAPVDEEGVFPCANCENKPFCSPLSQNGRVVTIPFDMLPHIDHNDPPMAKRFKAMMTRRPAVERMIKRLKCDLSDDRLSKRSNGSFQAYLDKTMIAFHILLRQ